MLPLFGSELIVFRAVFQNNEGGAWDSVEKKLSKLELVVSLHLKGLKLIKRL